MGFVRKLLKTALRPTSSVPRTFSWSLDFKVTSAEDPGAKNGPIARQELPRGPQILDHAVSQPWNGLSSTEVNKPQQTQLDGGKYTQMPARLGAVDDQS